MPGDHLEGDPFLRQRGDLLAAAPEDEGVAALEPQHPPALAGETHEQAVDLLLLHRVPVGVLAGVDPVRVPAHQIEDLVGDEAVVDHHVGLLEEAHGAKAEQIRIAGPRPHQKDLAGSRAGIRLRQRLAQRVPRLPLPPGEHHLGDRAAEDLVPEGAPLRGRPDPVPDLRPQLPPERGQTPEGGRDEGLQARPDEAGQHRRGPSGAHRRQHRGAVDDRGQDEVPPLGPRHRVREPPLPGRQTHDTGVERLVVGRGDHQPAAFEIARLESALAPAYPSPGDQRVERRAKGRGDHAHHGAGLEQHFRLAGGHAAATGHQAGRAADGEEHGQVVHQATRCRCGRGRRSRGEAGWRSRGIGRAEPEGAERRVGMDSARPSAVGARPCREWCMRPDAVLRSLMVDGLHRIGRAAGRRRSHVGSPAPLAARTRVASAGCVLGDKRARLSNHGARALARGREARRIGRDDRLRARRRARRYGTSGPIRSGSGRDASGRIEGTGSTPEDARCRRVPASPGRGRRDGNEPPPPGWTRASGFTRARSQDPPEAGRCAVPDRRRGRLGARCADA